ncbi:MAG TPA: fumarylacetoacetate hydrolase family protein [Chthoniobacteraceae bacterium]|jgi:2-dehydro-3-deoxy-D-arabinonate dehydratase
MQHPPVTVYRAEQGLFAQRGKDFFLLPTPSLDALFFEADPAAWLADQLARARPSPAPKSFAAPIESQEVWAAGVTYLRSRDARMDESKDAGGGTFYDRVYDAERPEIFFKATPHRVVGSGGAVRLRGDSRWNVPEPELTLAINREGRIFGYTVGNDMSSRDIEGENPLYLPQAKVYSACCGLGPGIVVRDPLPRDTKIRIEILRHGAVVFHGATALDQMKRQFPELAGFLYRDNDFPAGCFLLTGTGIVPPNDFTLAVEDEIRIEIGGVGTLVNIVR